MVSGERNRGIWQYIRPALGSGHKTEGVVKVERSAHGLRAEPAAVRYHGPANPVAAHVGVAVGGLG